MDDDYAGALALPFTEGWSERELLALLTTHVRRLLRDERDWLLSKLYRLDVRERDIQAVLAGGGDAAEGLAGLILARHHERAATREKYRLVEEPWDEELGDMSW